MTGTAPGSVQEAQKPSEPREPRISRSSHNGVGTDSIIPGSNIGTTITGWILVLKVGKYGLPLLGVAALAYLFSRRDRPKFIAKALMGLGMIFFGLELMKDGFALMKDVPLFMDAESQAQSTSAAITRKVRQLREDHLERMTNTAVDPHLSLSYAGLLTDYRRVRAHTVNVHEVMSATASVGGGD